MLLAVYQHLAEGFFVAFGEGWGAVGIDGAEVVLEGIEAYKPDMVIIDNVSDLLPSVNDTDASIQVIGQLVQVQQGRGLPDKCR